MLEESQVRRRQKLKNQKTADRTSAISKAESETKNSDAKLNGASSVSGATGDDTVLKEEKNDSDTKLWMQNQQKAFEWGLAQFPKGTPDRWDKIAEHITGKTKVSNNILQ
jgi:DnaJ family protein C protein 1